MNTYKMTFAWLHAQRGMQGLAHVQRCRRLFLEDIGLRRVAGPPLGNRCSGASLRRGYRPTVRNSNSDCGCGILRSVSSHPGQRRQRQPVAHRRIAGNQIQMLTAQQPRPTAPAAGPRRDSSARATHSRSLRFRPRSSRIARRRRSSSSLRSYFSGSTLIGRVRSFHR
jgi:hypothetical protein